MKKILLSVFVFAVLLSSGIALSSLTAEEASAFRGRGRNHGEVELFHQSGRHHLGEFEIRGQEAELRGREMELFHHSANHQFGNGFELRHQNDDGFFHF